MSKRKSNLSPEKRLIHRSHVDYELAELFSNGRLEVLLSAFDTLNTLYPGGELSISDCEHYGTVCTIYYWQLETDDEVAKRIKAAERRQAADRNAAGRRAAAAAKKAQSDLDKIKKLAGKHGYILTPK